MDNIVSSLRSMRSLLTQYPRTIKTPEALNQHLDSIASAVLALKLDVEPVRVEVETERDDSEAGSDRMERKGAKRAKKKTDDADGEES